MVRRLLVNKQDTTVDFLIRLDSWMWVLNLACACGWEPAGTLEPTEWRDLDYADDALTQMATDNYWEVPGSYDNGYSFTPNPAKGWSGQYFTDQGQEVTVADAIGLTKAMKRANGWAGPIERSETVSTLDLKYGRFKESETLDDGIIDSVTSDCEFLEKVISFCSKGAFHIR